MPLLFGGSSHDLCLCGQKRRISPPFWLCPVSYFFGSALSCLHFFSLLLFLAWLRIWKPTRRRQRIRFCCHADSYFDTCRLLTFFPQFGSQLFTLASQRHPAGSSSSFNDRPVPSHHRRRSSAGHHTLSEVRSGNLLSIHPRAANQSQLSPIVGTLRLVSSPAAPLQPFPRPLGCRLPCIILCCANLELFAG